MIADPSKYRGISINIEMADGRFLPSIHDPLRHKNDAYTQLPRCTSDTSDGAMSAAMEYIDGLVDKDIDSVRLTVKR